MVRQLTPQSTLENLKREAKRWLHALRDTDPGVQRDARARLDRAVPNAPARPSLRDVQHALAHEHGVAGWAALKNELAAYAPAAAEHASRIAWFIENACPDHHIRSASAHVRSWHITRRLLERYPDIPGDSVCTAIVCGDIDRVMKTLADRPEAATEKGGPKGWDPLLYLCFTRVPLATASDNAVAIARALLDSGADPNAHFMAGGSVYTPLVGVVGEGEENRPPHPQRDAIVKLLLERGAQPYDIQVIYNTGFHGRMLWFLEMIYEHTVKLGRKADWDDPDWSMLGMGGYGSGARWMLNIAVRNNDLTLARWVLEHGANPNAAPPRDSRMSPRSLYEDAVLNGLPEMADLLVQFGATPSGKTLEGVDALTAASLRLDAAAARDILARHPEYLRAPEPMLAAAHQDRADVVAFLLDLGVSPDVETPQGQRGLHVAAYENRMRVAQLLVERGAAIDPFETSWGSTPLGAANYAQNRAMIEFLGRVSRDIWELTNSGNIERLRELLRDDPARAKVVSDGHTPLMWLPQDDEARAMEVAELLLAHGADPTLRNNDGETAADRAAKAGLLEVADLLNHSSNSP